MVMIKNFINDIFQSDCASENFVFDVLFFPSRNYGTENTDASDIMLYTGEDNIHIAYKQDIINFYPQVHYINIML